MASPNLGDMISSGSIALGIDLLAERSFQLRGPPVLRTASFEVVDDDGVVRRKVVFVEPDSDAEDVGAYAAHYAESDEEIGLVRRDVVFVDPSDAVSAISRAPPGQADPLARGDAELRDSGGVFHGEVFAVDPEHEDAAQAAPADSAPSFEIAPRRPVFYVDDETDRVSDDEEDEASVSAIGSALGGDPGSGPSGVDFDESVGSCRLPAAAAAAPFGGLNGDAAEWDPAPGPSADEGEDWLSFALL
eukprot:tig00020902_g15037.t1